MKWTVVGRELGGLRSGFLNPRKIFLSNFLDFGTLPLGPLGHAKICLADATSPTFGICSQKDLG